jgi:hypothetical protein
MPAAMQGRLVLGLAVLGGVVAVMVVVARPRPRLEPAAVEAAPARVEAPGSAEELGIVARDRRRELEPPRPAAPASEPARAPARAQADLEEAERERLRAEAQAEPPVLPPAEPSEPAPPPEDPDPATAAARVAANEAVDAIRGEMAKACWDTLDKPASASAGAKLGFSLSYDAEGKVVASSVVQERDKYVEGLDRCLAPFAQKLEVPAPEQAVSLDLAFELP